jgi:hypothetical protein
MVNASDIQESLLVVNPPAPSHISNRTHLPFQTTWIE